MTLQDVLMEQVAILAKANRVGTNSTETRENAKTITEIARYLVFDCMIPVEDLKDLNVSD